MKAARCIRLRASLAQERHTLSSGNPLPTDLTEEQTHEHGDEGHAHDHEHDHDREHAHSHVPAINPECRREVTVEVPASEVEQQFTKMLKQYRKQARIPGFRAGKVPESLLRTRFAEQLRRDVLEELVPKYFREAIAKQGELPVSQPQVEKLDFKEGQPLKFTAAYEVLPTIDVTDYEHVTVEKPDVSLTDAEFDEALKRLADQRAVMEPIEEPRPLKDGDFAQITFIGNFSVSGDEAKEADPKGDVHGENALVEIGGKDTVDAFNHALRGATVGQHLKLEVDYPEDFGEKRLAGKTVSYEIEVTGAKKKIVPEFDDAFAKELGNYESAEEFRNDFRTRMAEDKQRGLESEARQKLIGALVEKYPFAVPEAMVQQQVDMRLERGLRALAAQGMKAEDMRKLDFERLRGGQREMALAEVRGGLILDRIGEVEKVEVTDDEMERELQMAALETREPIEDLRKRLTQDGTLSRIREQIRRDKTAQQLYNRQSQ
jgi:trigger factor